MKPWHIGVCVGLMVLAVVLVAAGAGALAFIAPLGCVAMMAMMVWMMASPRLRTRVRGWAGGLRWHRKKHPAAGH
ncbi:MAG TPA: hypothetical protein VK919_12950 [Solirubrobacterales bacterium]|nr:hypothetical protein [Solirubrobacterales bacterium]